MLKPIDQTAAMRPQAPLPSDVVNNVFKVLHGFYGNLFLSKFASGEVDATGQDKGVMSARMVWGHGLRDFDASTIKAALSQCIERHAEFPPSMPQFVQLCMANKVREVFKTDAPAQIGMSAELRSRYAEQARQKNRERAARALELATGYVRLPMSLDGLKQAIANAVATAGGDEAATLRRLDLMLAPRAAA